MFECLVKQDFFKEFLEQGRDIGFISSISNLGANPDERILKQISASVKEFWIEVTERTNTDNDGGIMVNYDKEGAPSSVVCVCAVLFFVLCCVSRGHCC